ncbi:TIM-barrel domain-containing protein [Sphingorhabdus arenilitoris]|uniref:TIM-barrel domain-containing protein n=1 Tax=Sphingorhabdus arenilitoris TaxID=1490041 RepID=A0ABV8RCR9_9SPHN
MRYPGLIIYGAICLLAALPSFAGAREYVSHKLEGQTLSIATDEGNVTVRAVSADAFEIVYDINEDKQFPSFALSGETQQTDVQVEENEDSILLRTPAMTATIEKSPLRMRYDRQGAALLSEEKGFFTDDKSRGFRFDLTASERLWGGGQRVLGMDRRGEILPLDNRGAYGYSDRSDAMYYGVPAVISDRKYMLLFDNSARGEMDLGKSEANILQVKASGGRAAYVVVAGQSYADIVQNYTAITGKQPLPPRWALGNMASRFGYRTEAETRSVVDKHFAEDFPLDAVILDLFWFGPDIKGHMGNLDWNRSAFPNPEGMIADFKKKGVNTILITEPFILSTSKRWEEALANQALARDAAGQPKTFDFYFGNGGLIDMFDPKASDWFWAKNRDLLNQGVAGIWGDLGEPEAHPSDIVHTPNWGADEVHNAYGHQWARMMSEKWAQDFPNQRPFLMMRSGFAGTQRFGIIPWSGDVSKTWPALQAQIEIALQMSVVGLAYSHSDLGGFVALDSAVDDGKTAVAFDKELYIRWLQFGAFQPVFRPHSQEQIPAEPVFQDEQTKDIVRRYIRTRYRLMPYLYTAAWQNSRTGMPMTRPLAFASDDPAMFTDQSAFLWGNDLLVAPVTQKAATSKSVPLPAGIWFDYWTGAKFFGGQTVSVPVAIKDIPVFVRAGAFIPAIGDIDTLRDYRTDRLKLHYYHDGSVTASTSQIYDDDGITPASQEKGLYELLNFQSAYVKDTLLIGLTRERHKAYAGQPAQRQMQVIVHNIDKAPRRVMVDGKKMVVNKGGLNGGDKAGVAYSASGRTLTINFPWRGDKANIAVRSGSAAN